MKLINRRAKFDYTILESFEAGIALTGEEVKSLKLGRGNLASSFVKIKAQEAWLLGVNIPPSGQSSLQNYDPTRARKLLLHKKQIISIETKSKQQKLTLLPLSLYTKGRLVKAQIAFAKGKKQFEKREAKKRKDIQRQTEKEMFGKY